MEQDNIGWWLLVLMVLALAVIAFLTFRPTGCEENGGQMVFMTCINSEVIIDINEATDEQD